MKEKLREADLQLAWSLGIDECQSLETTAGNQIRLINQGRWNAYDGPDFLEATLELDHLIIHGNVEIHLDAADWYRHKHHENPKYNSVILHVVLEIPNQKFKTINSLGHNIPTVVINLPRTDYLNTTPCEIHPLNPKSIDAQFRNASKKYLSEKVLQLYQCFDYSNGMVSGFKKAIAQSAFKILGKPNTECEFDDLFIQLWENRLTDISSHWLNTKKGRGVAIDKKISFGSKIIKNIKNHALPIHTAEFESYYQIFKIVIEDHFKNSILGNNLTRHFLLVSLFAWSSLIYKSDMMEKLLSKWINHKSYLPPSIIKKHPLSSIKSEHTFTETQLLDQYKSFCSKKECINCKIWEKGETNLLTASS